MAFGKLKKWLEGAVAQANPFDNGRTFDTVVNNQQPGYRQQAPAAVQQAVQGAKYGVLANNPQAQSNFLKSTYGNTQTIADYAPKSFREAGTGLGLGGVRSLTGLAQGATGLYDLATPGVGTNRFSKKLDDFAKFTDQTAQAEGVGNAYKVGQFGTDALTFAAGGAALKSATKIPQVAKVANPVINVGNKISAPIVNKLPQTAGGRIAGAGVKAFTNPVNQANAVGFTALTTGQDASKGRDISPQGVAANLAMNEGFNVGLPVAGRAVAELPGAARSGLRFVRSQTAKPQAPDSLINKQSDLLTARAAMEVKNKPTGPIDAQISNVDQQIKQATTRPILRPFTNEIGAVGKNVNEPPDFLKTSPEYIAAESKPRPDGSKVVVKASRNPETGKIQTRQELVDKNTDLPRAYQQPEVTDRLAQMGQKQRSEPPSLEPIPNAKKELNDSTNSFLGGYQADKTKNMGITRTLPELQEKDSIKLMDAIESGGDFNGLPPQVRTILDAKHQELTDAGIDIGYVKDYFPHSWKNEDEVRRAYQSLNQRASIQNERSLPTISEGISLGFKPRYTDYREAMNAYLNTADKLLQNRKYFDDLQKRGLINESFQPPKGMQVIDAPGIPKPRPYIDPDTGAQIQGNFYASPEVAKKLNRLFGDRTPSGAFEKGLDLSAYASRFLQDIGLAGGVPGTPLNAFTFAQVTKELLSGSVKNPIVATMKSFTKEGYRKYSDKNNDVIQALQRQGIKIRDDYNYKNLGDELTSMVEQEGGTKNAIARGWDKVFSDPTFKRFMPALQIEMFKKVQKGALKKGMTPEQAEKVAGDAVTNFYGLNRLAKESFRNKAGTDVATTVLFAPKYRESMVNFLIVNNAKALNPAKWGSREYRANQKFMVGAALLLAGENYANEYLNGVGMKDNPDGKKDKLIIPADKIPGKPTNGKDIAIPFLPSIATVPRYAGSAVYNTITGNQEQAVKDASGFLSFGLRPLVDTFATNENYFGDKIVEEGASPAEAAKQRAGYLLTQYQHPYIREAVRTAQGKNKSLFETASKASEAPLRFYDPKYYKYGDTGVPKGPEGEKYDFAQQRERADIKKEINNIAKNVGLSKRQTADFEALSAVEFNEDGTLKEDNNPFYKSQRFSKLQDDGVFEAMKQKAQLNAKLNGKPIDPIFNLDGQARRLVLWKKTLPPGTSDPSIKKLYEQDWYADFQKQEDQYYDAKKSWNTKMGYKNPEEDNTYPVASDTVKKAQDYYFTLPKGTGARSAWIRSNPETWNQMISFWNAKDQWTNGERSKLGLGPLDEKTNSTGSFAYSRRRSGGRKGRKGGNKGNSVSVASKGPKSVGVKVSSAPKAPSGSIKKPAVMRVARPKTAKIGGGKIKKIAV